jgi:hypothetical protein
MRPIKTSGLNHFAANFLSHLTTPFEIGYQNEPCGSRAAPPRRSPKNGVHGREPGKINLGLYYWTSPKKRDKIGVFSEKFFA